MDIKALQLEARFSLPPNSLGYCGKETAVGKFKECIIQGKCKEVGEELKHFIVLYPYLETIAEITNLPEFSYEVIEAYWLGNDLLKRAKPEHYDLLLKNFEKQGVPDFLVKELRQKPPRVFIPNHLFQVLHVGVGRASGAVPFNLQSINNCMIRWGEVVKLEKNKAIINLHSLELKDKRYKLIVNKEAISFNNELVLGIKLGDIVVAHWNMVIKILNKQEEKKLKYWTKQCLVLF
jgi:hypothetical protein